MDSCLTRTELSEGEREKGERAGGNDNQEGWELPPRSWMECCVRVRKSEFTGQERGNTRRNGEIEVRGLAPMNDKCVTRE